MAVWARTTSICVRELGDVGEHRHAVVAELHEATVHRDRDLGLALAPDDPDREPAERADERLVAGEEGDLTVDRTAHDHLRLTLEEDALR